MYIVHYLFALLYSYGRFISRYPAPFIVAPLLFTMAMVAGFFHLNPVTDAIYLFTPTDAPSKMERMSIHDKWPLSDGTYIPGRAVTQPREIQEGREPINLLVEDSYAILHYHILQDPFWKYGATLQIVVNNAPDLRIRGQRERVARLAHEIPTTSHSAGADSLQFWMTEMTNYYKTQLEMDLVDVAFYGMPQHYLSAKPKPWIEDVQWNKTAGSDDAYAIPHYRILEKYFWQYGSNLQDSTKAELREYIAHTHSLKKNVVSIWTAGGAGGDQGQQPPRKSLAPSSPNTMARIAAELGTPEGSSRRDRVPAQLGTVSPPSPSSTPSTSRASLPLPFPMDTLSLPQADTQDAHPTLTAEMSHREVHEKKVDEELKKKRKAQFEAAEKEEEQRKMKRKRDQRDDDEEPPSSAV